MNPFSMMKNLAGMPEQLKKAQEQMESLTATGSSGGNMVQITLNGKFELLSIKLDPICVDNRDVKMLEDLIKAAHTNALEKIQEELKNNSGALLSGLNIPGM